jgi:integrase/recombinase XerD
MAAEYQTRLYAVAPRGNRVRPVITSKRLVDLGMALMEKSKISPDKPISMAADAIRYRDGVMIALLAQVPLRPRNAAALEIGRDVIKEGETWSIVIPPEDTKTKTYLDFEIPEYRVAAGPDCTTICSNVAKWLAPCRMPS